MRAYDAGPRNQYPTFALGSRRMVTPDGPLSQGVTQRFTRSADGRRKGEPCAVYTAKNTDRFYGWGARGKRFAKPVNVTGHSALGFWVHGDGNDETVYLQLCDVKGRVVSFHVPVHFTGWQFWAFPREAKRGFDWKRVEYLLFYMIKMLNKRDFVVRISPVKALTGSRIADALGPFTLIVGDERLRLDGRLGPAQCITTDGRGVAAFWPGGMKPGQPVKTTGGPLVLEPGPNKITFTLADPKTYPGDVSVRLSQIWPLEK